MSESRFDPRTATEYEIVARAKAAVGKRLHELIASDRREELSSAKNKGRAGAIIEEYFGIRSNSEQAPDFIGAGVELKVAPLVMEGKVPRRIKERTSVTMIDYEALERESWENASVRHKLDKILFIFYEWRPDVPVDDMVVVKVRSWTPPLEMLPYLERDWMAVWRKNHAGFAHEISEGDGAILGAATKSGTGAKRAQPYSSIPATSRAWSLKPRLTWCIFNDDESDESQKRLLASLSAGTPRDPVEELLTRAEALIGMTIEDVCQRTGLKPGNGKHRVASVLRRAIGLPPVKTPKELAAIGLLVKTIPLGPEAFPHESMSFPAFDPRELIGEEWEDSELHSALQNMLLLPSFREKKKSDLLLQRVCRPFRWAANREELAGIRLEWERCRDLIAEERWKELPSQKKTRYIHIRPHGKNKKDKILTATGGMVMRQCFWLNSAFVQELVRSHNGNWLGF